MFSITVDADALKALTITASTCATRHMLVGVCVDTMTPGRVHLVSTDGHRMLIVNATHAPEGNPAPGRYILPLFDVKSVKPIRKGIPIVIDILPGNPGKFCLKGKSEISGTCVDGSFPEWRRVTPQETSGEMAHYNFGYVGDFQRIGELLGVEFPTIQHNGNSAALINLGADAFGILMPIRADHVAAKASPPDWIVASQPQDVAQAA